MKKIFFLTSLLSLPALAMPESRQVFFGVKSGYQWAVDDNYVHSYPDGTVLGLYGGLHFTPSLSWDLGYQYHDVLKADITSVNVHTWLFESALRYDWYLQDNLSLYGRLGMAYWDVEKTQHSADKLDATGFSPLGEVGARYYVTPSLSLSAGYQYIDSIGNSNTGKYDSHAALINLMYTFSHNAQSSSINTTPVIENIAVPEEEMVATKPKLQASLCGEKNIEGRFELDAIKPSDDFVQSLNKVASVLKTYPQTRAVIVGHTDSTGTQAYNQTLSERRAQAVMNQLVHLGVEQGQLEWRGEGELSPIADNTTVEGKAQNRRVEITFQNLHFERQAES